jgi:hypothetical protein
MPRTAQALTAREKKPEFSRKIQEFRFLTVTYSVGNLRRRKSENGRGAGSIKTGWFYRDIKRGEEAL